jgi:hypothetical protein
VHRTPTVCKLTVSISISLPSRGSFHLSLTVLSSISHLLVFSLGRWSSLIPARFHVSRGTLYISKPSLPFRLRGSYPLWPDFPVCSSKASSTSVLMQLHIDIYLPLYSISCTLFHCIGLGSSPFARRYSENLFFDFFSLGYLDVSLPPVPLYRLLFSSVYTSPLDWWVSPFGYPRLYAS